MTWNLLIGTSWESARTTSTTSRWPTVSTSGATPSTLRPFLETSSPVLCSQREGNCWYSSSQNVRRQRRRWWPLGIRQWPRSSTTRPSPRFGLFLSDRSWGRTNSWLSAEFTRISFLDHRPQHHHHHHHHHHQVSRAEVIHASNYEGSEGRETPELL